MFEGLSDRLSDILSGLTRRGALTEADVTAALREVRRALLEADVALEVVRGFTEKVREKAVGAVVLKSVTPGQMVVKIVNDELVAMLGSEAGIIDLNAPAPVAILMVGLQGSGKTTTTAKIARRLASRDKRRVLLASSTPRPAAMEQLAILAKQVEVESLPIVAGQSAVQIARRAMDAARLGGFDVVMLDTAGRVTLDEALMAEAAEVKAATQPHEVLLVADALTGQDAVNTARAFDERLGVTGIVLTVWTAIRAAAPPSPCAPSPASRSSSWARARRSTRWRSFTPPASPTASSVWATSSPWSRRRPRPSTTSRRSAPRRRCARASSTSTTCRCSSPRWKRWAAIGGLMGMLPGMGQIKKQVENANLDEKMFRRQRAIISSMTAQERKNPDILKNSARSASLRARGRRWRS